MHDIKWTFYFSGGDSSPHTSARPSRARVMLDDDPATVARRRAERDRVECEIALGASVSNDSQRIEDLRARINAFVDASTSGHVWGVDALRFNVHDRPSGVNRRATLRGSIRVGDGAAEDGWLVARIARDVTMTFDENDVTCARVWDEDGEFVLVECAETLEAWVTPERAEGTTFFVRGELRTVDGDALGGEPGGERTRRAMEIVEKTKGLGIATQEMVRARLDAVETRIVEHRHAAFAIMPRMCARILAKEPQLVALAMDSLRARDPVGLRAAAKMEVFEPKDFHPTLVQMSRALFVQITSEHFDAPPTYSTLCDDPAERRAREIGMKIACGLEMFIAEWTPRKSSDGESTSDGEPEDDPAWERFKSSLTTNGYFREEIMGSKLYKDLLTTAVREYRRSGLATKVRRVQNEYVQRVSEILDEKYDADDVPHANPSDASDEDWLVNAEQELMEELARLEKEREKSLVEATKKAKSFVSRESGFEGVDHNATPGSCPGDLNIPNGDGVFNLDAQTFLKELGKALRMGDDEKFRAYMGPYGVDSDDDQSSDSDDADFDFPQSDNESVSSRGLPEDDYFDAPPASISRANFIHVDEDAPDSDDDDRAFATEYDAVLRAQLADTKIDVTDSNATDADVSAALASGLLASASAAAGAPSAAASLLAASGADTDAINALIRAVDRK